MRAQLYNFGADSRYKPRPPSASHLQQLATDPVLRPLLERALGPALRAGEAAVDPALRAQPLLEFSDAARLLRVARQQPLDLGALGAALVALDNNIRAPKDGPPTEAQLQELQQMRQAILARGQVVPKFAEGTPATYGEAMFKIALVIRP
ncbi:hypothetical protein HXX76_011014 [Chlamydomonas incerta]|uniref:Uncharacterized protein n=1 Tax=Chlamydomonas incerta TaxID=51695 RepID=A0A835SZF8_CHLIN|nr:hypothetical protein HXX76_011014 [Chlamydomonas incerta]|eukprot:KAG2429245.1 hypothetical protein HXX76_011014 [Chlamydomonas incerta]